MPGEPREMQSHPDLPQTWDLLHGDAEDLVYALVGAFGGEFRILEGSFIAWVPRTSRPWGWPPSCETPSMRRDERLVSELANR